MNRTIRNGRWNRVCWVLLATTLALPGAQAANVVYLVNGQSIEAKSVQWRESAQEYRIETPDGTIIPKAKKDIERFDIEAPAEMSQAEQMMASGQMDAALPLLQKVVDSYRMIVWDNKARALQAQIYARKQDPKKAVSVLDEAFKTMDPAEIDLPLRRLYWECLLGADRTAALKKDLDETIAAGSRESAAEAQVMRGNMSRAQGAKEDALLDYLRTVLLFEDVKSVQPEALAKTAQLLDELRDPRAAEMRKRLMQEYPESDEAKALSGSM